MSVKTFILLLLNIFNAAWLCYVFVMLFFYGEVTIPEHNQAIAGFEVLFTFSMVVLGVERLFRLREKIGKD